MSTTTCLIRQRASDLPDAPAILAPGHVFDYTALDAAVGRASSQLRAMFPAGGRLIAPAPASVETAIYLHACFRAGSTACPVHPRLPQAALLEIAGRLGPQAAWFAAQQPPDGCRLPRLDPRARESFAPMASGEILLDAPATLVHSSGSMGPPKAVVHAYGNHLASARAANLNLPLGPGDCWLLSLPLYHVAGIAVLFRCALAGAAVVIPQPGIPLEQSILRQGITHVSLVATQLYRLLSSTQGRTALGALKGILLGGGPTPERLLREAHALGLPLVNSYGMTETASQVCATALGASPEELLSAGKPLVGARLSLSPTGEIKVAGDMLFSGYLEADVPRRPLDAEGFFRTGDLGALDARGNLRVLGRQDNLFISGGENIHPEEIERELGALPAVRTAMAVPVPDAEFGQVPAAFVDWRPGECLTLEALRHALGERLPRFKLPRYVFEWHDDASAVSLKPSRVAMRLEAVKRLEGRDSGTAFRPETVRGEPGA